MAQRTSIQDIISLAPPAQAWNFDLFLPVIPGSSSTRDLTYRCMTTDIPGTQLEPLEVALHGVQVPYPGRRMFTQSMNVTFLEGVDWETTRKFHRWIELARSWRQNNGLPGPGAWVTGQLVFYDDTPSVVRTQQINAMWPSNLQETQADGSATAAINISIEFKYTDWEEQ